MLHLVIANAEHETEKYYIPNLQNTSIPYLFYRRFQVTCTNNEEFGFRQQMLSVYKQGKAGSEPQLGFPFPLWKLPNSTTKYTKQFLNHQFTASNIAF